MAAVVAAGVEIYQNWDEIVAATERMRQKLSEIWDGIKDSIASAIDFIKEKIEALIDSFPDLPGFELQSDPSFASPASGRSGQLRGATQIERELGRFREVAPRPIEVEVTTKIEGQIDGAEITRAETNTVKRAGSGSNHPVSGGRSGQIR